MTTLSTTEKVKFANQTWNEIERLVIASDGESNRLGKDRIAHLRDCMSDMMKEAWSEIENEARAFYSDDTETEFAEHLASVREVFEVEWNMANNWPAGVIAADELV